MLAGQVADGLTTVFAGELVCIDKINNVLTTSYEHTFTFLNHIAKTAAHKMI